MRSVNILMFLVFLNAAAALLGASGVAADIGVQPDVGGGDAIQKANQSAQSLDSSSEGVQTTFIGNAISAAKTAASSFSVVYAGPSMIANLGVPGWMVAFIFAPMYFVVALDIMSIFVQMKVQG